MKQYHKIQKEKLAYFAGLFDGEGCICIMKYKSRYKNKEHCYRAFIQIAMTDKRPIEKNYFQWTMRCGDAAKFLTILLPMLLVKKQQAKNLIEFSKEYVGQKGTSEKSNKIREKLYLLNKKLNQKGNANLSKEEFKKGLNYKFTNEITG